MKTKRRLLIVSFTGFTACFLILAVLAPVGSYCSDTNYTCTKCNGKRTVFYSRTRRILPLPGKSTIRQQECSHVCEHNWMKKGVQGGGGSTYGVGFLRDQVVLLFLASACGLITILFIIVTRKNRTTT